MIDDVDGGDSSRLSQPHGIRGSEYRLNQHEPSVLESLGVVRWVGWARSGEASISHTAFLIVPPRYSALHCSIRSRR